MNAATTIRLGVVPLTKRIGREIRGIDLRDDLTPSNFSQCWSSFIGR
jgi:alpha-ketoglutarate-dependent taurine dioxygenase